MKIGDTIQCHDKDDLIDTMIECARSGIETNFNYDDDKPKLVVTAISHDNNTDTVTGIGEPIVNR